MKTFSEMNGKMVVVACNQTVKNFLIDYALSKAVPVGHFTCSKENDFDEWPNLSFVEGEIDSNSNKAGDRGIEWITIEQFIEYCDNWQSLQPLRLPLTPSYDARISKFEQVVKVGCQTIPFSKIKEVYAACFDEPCATV